MQSIIDILKSRGRLGASAIMIIGVGMMVGVYLGKITGTYQDGAVVFFLGLSLMGIRGALPEPPK